MKKQLTLQHYVAYFVALVLMTTVILIPFAGTALLKYLFGL